MNFVFISPDFPKSYYHFCKELKKNGVNVFGITHDSFECLSVELQGSLTAHYQVHNMDDYNQMYEAVKYFESLYGKIDFIESNNEYWLETDARLRSDFNVTTGRKFEEINYFKSKEAMKQCYKKANVKVARYIIPEKDGLEAGRNFVKEVGYPVIVKPDNGVGAYHTYKIHNDDELIDFYFNHFPSIKYIMEEFIKGELISYDGITDKDANPVFSSNEVFPTPVMDVVNKNLDFMYYSNKTMPADLEEAGKAVLKAFDAKYRYFHLEFFRLSETKTGLGNKGDIIGLEVNMRCPGGYTPDIINFSKSIDSYKIWADIMTFNKTEVNMNTPHYYSVYYGRRDNHNYLHPMSEVYNTYRYQVRMCERLPDVLSGAMGNDFIVCNFTSLEDMKEFVDYISK